MLSLLLVHSSTSFPKGVVAIRVMAGREDPPPGFPHHRFVKNLLGLSMMNLLPSELEVLIHISALVSASRGRLTRPPVNPDYCSFILDLIGV